MSESSVVADFPIPSGPFPGIVPLREREWLLYTTSNEDSQSELNALQIQPTDRVVAITGSGCRALALLAPGPELLVAVDAVPEQNHLLSLKLAAIKMFPRQKTLEFLGIRACDDRLALYQEIRPYLSNEAATFWDQHLDKIAQGVIFSGRQEVFFRRWLRPVLLGLRKKWIEQLMHIDDLEFQRQFYRETWNNWWWRTAIRLLCQPWIFKTIMNDPSYYAHINVSSLGEYLLERIDHTFEHHLLRENHFMSFLMTGGYISDNAMPVYLTPEYYDKIKIHADRVKIVHAPIDTFLAACPDQSFDKYSLSDISGWMSSQDFEKVLLEVVRTSRNGAVFCYRNFVAKRPIPSSLSQQVEPLHDVAERLNQEDRSFAFTFEVGRVHKPVTKKFSCRE